MNEVRLSSKIMCPKCNIEVTGEVEDSYTGGYWEKCNECGMIFDHNGND